MTVDLSEIKLYSEANFENVSETDDDKLYFVEDDGGGGTITEYSSGTSGYIIFPNGMCIQWGEVNATTSGVNVSLSKTYADTNYAAFATVKATTKMNNATFTYNTSTSLVKIGCYAAVLCKWMTIGQLASGQY